MQRLLEHATARTVPLLVLALALVLAFLPDIARAETNDCTLETIQGTYVFQARGALPADGGWLPYAEAGSHTLDGAGNGVGIFSAGLGGETIADREDFTVTYELVSGCAYAAYAPIAGETFEFHFFTSPSGDTITYYSDGISGTMWRQEDLDDHAHAMDETIANALSAGPASITHDAAVLDWPSEHNPDFSELRAGSNGWTCVPDDPATPTNDPMCLDEQWLEWLMAFAEGRDPEITTFGWSYMLQGGGAASDADPYLMEPPEGEEWLVGPPHLMLLAPGAYDTTAFPTDRDSGGPYIMWAGTPYEHFMIPVQFDVPAETDDPVANALSAAPDAIAAEATVLAWPSDANPDFSELRAGSNGWTCVPDDPATPGNDPMCLDDQWVEWLMAFAEGRDPVFTKLGFSYMLQGGTAASDADPFLMEPPDGEEWLSGPPHIMLVAPDAFDTTLFPTDRDSGEPYVMWAGTPYEHFMAASQPDVE